MTLRTLHQNILCDILLPSEFQGLIICPLQHTFLPIKHYFDPYFHLLVTSYSTPGRCEPWTSTPSKVTSWPQEPATQKSSFGISIMQEHLWHLEQNHRYGIKTECNLFISTAVNILHKGLVIYKLWNGIRDDRSLRHRDQCYNTLIPECRSLALFHLMWMGGCNGHTNKDWGPRRQLQFSNFSLACWIHSLPILARSEGRSVRESTRCC